MIIKNKIIYQEVKNGGISFDILESGDIHDISFNDNQINLLKGNIVDGSIANLYLRVFDGESIQFTRLIGRHSPSSYQILNDKVIYQGHFIGVDYQVILTVMDYQWSFEVSLKSETTKTVDVIYGQDIAISNKSSVLSSEAYTVQYIDYKSYKNAYGYTLCARQNQGIPQFLQLGSLQKNVAYSTDGFQFFGLSYKETGSPEAMFSKRLASEIYQYEFSYFALQSEIMVLKGHEKTFVFYGLYIPNYPTIIEKPETLILNLETPTWYKPAINKQKKSLLFAGRQLNGKDVSIDEMTPYIGSIRHEEKKDGKLLSFFTDRHHHVVLKQKELLVERPHGHLLIHGDLLHVSEEVMASTNFMFGVFNSHIVLGNTSFNKMLGDMRNALNLNKISGQRIYIHYRGAYHLLGLPSFYEMGGNTVKWYYMLEDDLIIIELYAHINALQQTLNIISKNGVAYDFMLTHQLLMGQNEYLYDIEVDHDVHEIVIHTPKNAIAHRFYKDLKYRISSDQTMGIVDEQVAFNCKNQHGLLIIDFKQQTHIKLDISATIKEDFNALVTQSFQEADVEGTHYFERFTQGFQLIHEKEQQHLSKLVDIVFWYTHNALTHYASPHGLEQYNGAAWGTRDICQGPIEFFSTTQNYSIVREILLKVYGRQFLETGDFPQWYMFDNYYQIQAHESHGDIIIWPLRSLAYYLKATKDDSILHEKVPFMSLEKQKFTEPQSLLDHIDKQLEAINNSFIKGTHLPAYGGGDWDDTLQPANHDLTTKMVSGWTVALLYEAIHQLSIELKDTLPKRSASLMFLAQHIRDDYETYMIVDEIPAGFVIFNDEIEYLLHPKDEKTGLQYRLLPFTRSMIAELANQRYLAHYLDIIDVNLKHPDGVRLMNTVVTYHGGKKTYFTRAETAANFGREVGLLYVHAHIRYIEAMAKIGNGEDAYEGLFKINPILVQEKVPNAMYRQSNVYFSSSDAFFLDRYQARREFERVKKGDIQVKGGWRLYSSGPGIYMNQLISNVLGIRIMHGDLVIDPVLPYYLDGMKVSYHYLNKPIEITYHFGEEKILLNGRKIEITSTQQVYRQGGYVIHRDLLLNEVQPIKLNVWYK
ncbi:MAG: cellobiose phosphorylase [Acholeplasmataceae bacterium]|nr:cellobiose phosphorylase [Acholeplasmataceae bacterium]